ncbi:MAG TPA: hypothetical protein VKQ30_21670 [Ktedonobacterales bacterium]|nr:hypothetical protein [Ktedonobacterales bacterium]
MSTWPAEIEGAVGARGLVVRWEHTDFTITSTTTPEELAAIADRYNSPRWVLADWMDELAHVGQTAECIGIWAGFGSIPAVVMLRFRDGYETQAWVTDVRFD